MDPASTDPHQLALQIFQYATSGNWRSLAAVCVLAVVWLIRNKALHPSALGRFPKLLWLKTDRGGVTLNFLVSILGGVSTALAANQPLTVDLFLTAAVNSCIAAGVFVSAKRLAGKPAEVQQPTPADPSSGGAA